LFFSVLPRNGRDCKLTQITYRSFYILCNASSYVRNAADIAQSVKYLEHGLGNSGILSSSQQRQEIFLSSKLPDKLRDLHSLPLHCVPTVKLLDREADHFRRVASLRNSDGVPPLPTMPSVRVHVKYYSTVPLYIRGPGISVGIATSYGLDGPEIESRWGARLSARVQTVPLAHPASFTMGTGSFPGLKSGRRVRLTPHPF
jgi:hypothetical protein